MKKYILFLVACFSLMQLTFSCSKTEVSTDLQIVESPSPLTNISIVNTKSQSQNSLVYHQETDLVLQAIPDYLREPNIVSPTDSRATHIAVKFYPRNSEEQFMIDGIKEISSSYIPFGYQIASKDMQVKYLKKALPAFKEHNPNRILLKASEIDANGTIANINSLKDSYVTLPVLYSICPIDYVIPRYLDYEVCFAMSIEVPIQPYPMYLPLKIDTYDSLLGTYLPLNKIKVREQYGNITADEYTNSNGTVSLCPLIYGIYSQNIGDITIVLILETDKWIINRNASGSTPTHIVLGRVRDLWPNYDSNPPTYHKILSSENKEIEAHRALDFYFNVNNPLSEIISSSESGSIVHCLPESSDDYLAYTYASNKDITIFNSSYSQNVIIGTTLHELGHIRHYEKIDDYNTYYSSVIEKKIKESYASFIGWLIGENYYLSKGFVKPYNGYNINSNHRQNWYLGGPLADYTPLFIDLVDNYNQGSGNPNLPFDNIESVPCTFVDNIVNSEYSVNGVFSYLNNYVGTYFTTTDLQNYENAY